MKNIPKQAIVIAGSVVIVSVVLGGVYFWKKTDAPQKQVVQEGEVQNSTSTTVSEVAQTKKAFSFAFDKEAIQPLVDSRSYSYSFYVEQDIIGVITLHPAERNGKVVTSFAEWVKGLNGKIKIGEEMISVQRKKIGKYDTIVFETVKDTEKGYNVITEAFGQTLWLQSKISEASLETFLKHLTGITKN